MCDENNTGLAHITYKVIYISLCYIRGKRNLQVWCKLRAMGREIMLQDPVGTKSNSVNPLEQRNILG